MKKVLYSLIAIIAITLLFPSNVFALTDNIAVYYDDSIPGNKEYLIYISGGSCSYALNDGATPVIYQTCSDTDSNGHTVIIANRDTASYLWMKDNGTTPFKLEDDGYYDNALKKSVAGLIYTKPTAGVAGIGTMDRILVEHGEKNVKVIDTQFEHYDYIRIKVEDTPHELLEYRVSQLQKLNESTNPYDAISLMKLFKESYDNLLPAFDDSRWTNLDGNMTIDEPATTKTGDIYVIWLRGYDILGNATYDVQIMYCLEETIPSKLPYTGMNLLLSYLLGANFVILSIIYFKRRKLVKNNI